MKRILSVLICLLCTVYVKSQTIDGLGIIRLGMTISDFQQSFPDAKNEKDFNENLTKTFVLNEYIPVKGYSLTELHLSFYNDSLYAMYTIMPTNIKEALTIKYGEPQITHESTPKEYVNGLGNTITKEDQSFNLKWDTGNPDIICYYNDQVKHDSRGKANRYISFGIENQKIFQIIKSLLEQKKQKQDEIQKQDKLKDLEGL